MISLCKAVICDPRVVASFVTMGLIFVDDNASGPYFTGWDPTTAMALSIILGQAIALGIVRKWDAWAQLLLVLAIIGKCTLKQVFWIRHAEIPVLYTFFVAHLIIAGFTSIRPAAQCAPHWISCCIVGCLGAIIGFALFIYILSNQGDLGRGVWGFACINSPRVLFPYFFWTAFKSTPDDPLPASTPHATHE